MRATTVATSFPPPLQPPASTVAAAAAVTASSSCGRHRWIRLPSRGTVMLGCGQTLTERGAPHRETAQAPLCRFGRGPWVRENGNTQDTGDVYRFGPLRSPYAKTASENVTRGEG
uniref:Uncharacterized protein n=1 Tax=Oryza rufipogon TaxID=4529 RepID=A0A0E0Q320_ORYRU